MAWLLDSLICTHTLCRRKDPADARGYFYMLKQRGIGVRSALLQHQWAKLEADSGAMG
jgi:hypothetical protein